MTATMTVNSGVAAYATGADFTRIFDYRTFAQLASDTDVPLANALALQTSTILLTQLRIGAGNIEMAVTVGQRYDPADLAKLLLPTITNSGYALIELNCVLAAVGMFQRRFEALPEFLRGMAEQADAKLEALEQGRNILGFAEVQQAGIIKDYQETAEDVQARNLPSYVARRCFGRRDNRLPYGRNA